MSRRGIGAISINPFILLAAIYFTANLHSFVAVLAGQSIQVDQLVKDFDRDTVYITGSLLLASFCFFFALYGLNSIFPAGKHVPLSGRWGWVLFLIQVAYFAYSQFYGINIAGVENVESGGPLKTFFVFFDPDLLYLIIATSLASNRLFLVNTGIFVVSMLLRGWGGAFVLVPVVVFCRYYPIRLDRIRATISLIVFFLLLFASPFFMEIKWAIRSGAGVSESVMSLMDRGYVVSLGDTITYLLNRFQMFGHVALLVENSGEVSNAYNKAEFIPYWADGLPQWVALKLAGIDIVQLNRYIVRDFFDSTNTAYSTNPGVAGWLAVLGERSVFFLFFLFCIVFFPAYYLRKRSGRLQFLLLYTFSLIYLLHGWVGAYVNMSLYMIAIAFVKRLSVRANTEFIAASRLQNRKRCVV